MAVPARKPNVSASFGLAKAAEEVGQGPEKALLALLRLEEEIRSAESPAALQILAVNEAVRLLGARQTFAVALGKGRHQVVAVSSLTSVNRDAPLIQAIERLLRSSLGASIRSSGEPRLVAAKDLGAEPTLDTYPFRAALWVPLTPPQAEPLGGLLVMRERPWTEPETVIARRIGVTLGHALAALGRGRSRRQVPSAWKLAGPALVAIALCLALVRVPMTALAPFTVAARAPEVVAASIDGVIAEIPVTPNAVVAVGDVLVRLNDVTARNRLDIAEHELAVAEARMKRMRQLAFEDARGRHELGITEADLRLKVAERDYARDMLAKTVIKARSGGLVLFADKPGLIGRPVVTGERIMDIADPAEVQLAIDVSVADSITLAENAAVSAFFDADPLAVRRGSVTHADYEARQLPGEILAYRVIAQLPSHDAKPPRLGSRGVAHIQGRSVPLGYYLFRRPLSALRQRLGL